MLRRSVMLQRATRDNYCTNPSGVCKKLPRLVSLTSKPEIVRTTKIEIFLRVQLSCETHRGRKERRQRLPGGIKIRPFKQTRGRKKKSVRSQENEMTSGAKMHPSDGALLRKGSNLI